jgi:drug/metabolite transporter (DMT)-like permease
MHLMPVFGMVLAVLFVSEWFYLYHVIGVALSRGGSCWPRSGRRPT